MCFKNIQGSIQLIEMMVEILALIKIIKNILPKFFNIFTGRNRKKLTRGIEIVGCLILIELF